MLGLAIIFCGFISNLISRKTISPRSKRFRGGQGQRITARKKSGDGEGRKETLAVKPLDFENRLLGLSCLIDFMLSSAVIN